MIKSPAQIELNRMRAKYRNDITEILRPYYSFRLYVKFIKPIIISDGPRKGEIVKNTHRYGYEQECSYNQCLAGHYENIVLDKSRGWRYCVHMAESDFKSTYYKAQIFTRSIMPDGKFDVLLREYNDKGEIIVNDYDSIQNLIHPSQNKTLYYTIDQKQMLQLTEEVIPSALDFKQLVTESLNI